MFFHDMMTSSRMVAYRRYTISPNNRVLVAFSNNKVFFTRAVHRYILAIRFCVNTIHPTMYFYRNGYPFMVFRYVRSATRLDCQRVIKKVFPSSKGVTGRAFCQRTNSFRTFHRRSRCNNKAIFPNRYSALARYVTMSLVIMWRTNMLRIYMGVFKVRFRRLPVVPRNLIGLTRLPTAFYYLCRYLLVFKRLSGSVLRDERNFNNAPWAFWDFNFLCRWL